MTMYYHGDGDFGLQIPSDRHIAHFPNGPMHGPNHLLAWPESFAFLGQIFIPRCARTHPRPHTLELHRR